ncbi:translation initiation factor IF-2-like [Sciurus carolinensis]|uniref:translation initiation factor IF-2-like n=1 Tax=Sciurus carolinensis TaxID=30640 RepID=UPI001FB537F6|nr:translation initiation factor IF-2-like [Sciurus carolinensis]
MGNEPPRKHATAAPGAVPGLVLLWPGQRLLRGALPAPSARRQGFRPPRRSSPRRGPLLRKGSRERLRSRAVASRPPCPPQARAAWAGNAAARPPGRPTAASWSRSGSRARAEEEVTRGPAPPSREVPHGRAPALRALGRGGSPPGPRGSVDASERKGSRAFRPDLAALLGRMPRPSLRAPGEQAARAGRTGAPRVSARLSEGPRGVFPGCGRCLLVSTWNG